MGNGDGRPTEGALDKALAVLGAFTPERGPIGVSDVARIAGVSKSTAFRILSTFVEWRYLEREGSAYAIGPRLSIQDSQRRDTRRDQLRETAMPVMQSLFEMTHETVHLAVLGDGVVEYLEKLFGPNAAKSPSRVGATLPANCSALGKAMLAFSDRPVQHRACTRLHRLTPYSITSPSVLFEQFQTIRSARVAFMSRLFARMSKFITPMSRFGRPVFRPNQADIKFFLSEIKVQNPIIAAQNTNIGPQNPNFEVLSSDFRPHI